LSQAQLYHKVKDSPVSSPTPKQFELQPCNCTHLITNLSKKEGRGLINSLLENPVRKHAICCLRVYGKNVSVTAESFRALCNKGFSYKALPWILAIDLHYEHLLHLEAHCVKGGGN